MLEIDFQHCWKLFLASLLFLTRLRVELLKSHSKASLLANVKR